MSHFQEKAPVIAPPSINSLFSSVTGPLSVKYCDLFFVLTWIIFIFIVLFIASGIYGFFTSKVKISMLQIILGIISLIFYFLVYILYRIFYNICLHSL
jgi:hypothetical protein